MNIQIKVEACRADLENRGFEFDNLGNDFIAKNGNHTVSYCSKQGVLVYVNNDNKNEFKEHVGDYSKIIEHIDNN